MDAVAVAVDAVPYRAAAERFWSFGAPSAAKLESIGAGVMTVITVAAVKKLAVKKTAPKKTAPAAAQTATAAVSQ